MGRRAEAASSTAPGPLWVNCRLVSVRSPGWLQDLWIGQAGFLVHIAEEEEGGKKLEGSEAAGMAGGSIVFLRPAVVASKWHGRRVQERKGLHGRCSWLTLLHSLILAYLTSLSAERGMARSLRWRRGR